jgi:hypothetical protein
VPDYEVINMASAVTIESLSVEIKGLAGYEIRSEPKPLIESAETVDALLGGREEDLKREYYPVLIKEESKLPMRVHFLLRCTRNGQAITSHPDSLFKANRRISTLFGMDKADTYQQHAVYHLTIWTNKGRVDHEFPEKIPMIDKEYPPPWPTFRDDVSPWPAHWPM